MEECCFGALLLSGNQHGYLPPKRSGLNPQCLQSLFGFQHPSQQVLFGVADYYGRHGPPEPHVVAYPMTNL